MRKKPRLLSVGRYTVKKSVYLIMGLLLALPGWAQAANDRVSLTAKQQSVVEIFKVLEKQSSYMFMYHDEDLLRLGRKDIEVTDAPLTDVLNTCLAGSNITYEIEGNRIVFQRAAVQQQPARSVSGTVADTKEAPITGAAVLIDGTQTGAVTDARGRFTLTTTRGDATVFVVTFLGYKEQKVTLGNRTELNIIMEEDAIKVEDVVVTGYATIDRGSYVGAVTQIKADDIQIAGESSIDQMLQGWIPGMSVVNTSGKVGASPKIRIRGTSTILGNQEPLWVVDGVIQRDPNPIPNDASPLSSEMDGLRETASNAISWLNPSDIETITVLKDASSTAIYGSQAANGVIVITTKKAKEPGLGISYSGNFTIGQKPGYQLYDLMNSQELMQFAQELYMDRNSYTQAILPIGYGGLVQRLQDKTITQEEFETEFRKLENQNTDWFDLLYRNSFSQTHNVSVSGMGEKLSSRFSVGLNRQFGDAKENELTSFSANSNTTYRVNDRLMIDLQLSGTYRETQDYGFEVSPYTYAMNTARTIPVYNDDGSLFYHEKWGATSRSITSKNSYNYNILNEIENTGSSTRSANMMASLNMRWQIIDNLEFQASASYQVSSSKVKGYATELSYYITQTRGYEYGDESIAPNSTAQKSSPLPFGGLLQTADNLNNDYSFRTSLLYYNTFNYKHRLTLQLGFEATSASTNGNAAARYGYLRYRGEQFATVPFVSDLENATSASGTATDLHEKMRAASEITTTKDNKLSEYFTTVYNYDDRYVINMNARLDASNRFGQDENKKFNPSWSVGAKWRIGNERWMDWASSWYDMFDISVSYGWRGNAVQAVSPYMIARDGGLNTYFQQYVLELVSLPYPDLGWEKTKDWNVGVDFSFLEGRLGATLNLYESRSEVLSSRDVAVEYGVANAYIDGTTMVNRGYDVVISATPVRTNDFTWSLSFNAGKARNTVKNNQRVNTREDYLSGNAIVSGQAYGTLYAWAFDGLDPDTGLPTFRNMDITATDNPLNYLVKVGCLEPDFAGGFNTMFRYKKFSLRANFAVSFGAQAYLPEVYASSGAPTPEQNAPRYLFKRWRKAGDVTDIPAIPYGYMSTTSVTIPDLTGTMLNPYTMYNRSDNRVADADFIRCRNISLQYDLPQSVAGKLHMKRISCTASMTNPFFIAFDKAWDGRDPETASWPQRRTVSFSLNITF